MHKIVSYFIVINVTIDNRTRPVLIMSKLYYCTRIIFTISSTKIALAVTMIDLRYHKYKNFNCDVRNVNNIHTTLPFINKIFGIYYLLSKNEFPATETPNRLFDYQGSRRSILVKSPKHILLTDCLYSFKRLFLSLWLYILWRYICALLRPMD